MSTKVSAVYDAMITKLQTALAGSGFVRLPNPYKIDANNELFLRQGYCVSMGAGRNSDRILSGKLTIERQFIVTLTRKIVATDADPTAKATADKQILEDCLTVIKEFESDWTFGGQSVVGSYLSDTGVQQLSAQNQNFVQTDMTFAVEYFEDLN